MAVSKDPAPYVAISTTQWDGLDGNWSTFRMSVGGSDPSQDFRVLVSTREHGAWVPTYNKSCLPKYGPDCPSSRGAESFRGDPPSGFQTDSSSTWSLLGIYGLKLEENLGFKDYRTTFGIDKVHLGFSGDTDAIGVNNTLVVPFYDPNSWTGLLGMGDVNTTLSDQKPIKSLIQTLNDTGSIPSLSYGYTAGAHHRNPQVPGSLVIGGYDQSRFQSPSASFTLASEQQRVLAVGLQSIYTNFSLTASSLQNLIKGHTSVIDSTVSHLWLPEDACNNFAAAFGLTYDERANYYLINDTMHEKLLDKNPTFTFIVGKGEVESQVGSVQIKLPYAAFDLSIRYPAYGNKTGDEKRYFPIRRANDSSQYTIGRVFLQEAYLRVDYERKNFSLAQATFSDNLPTADIQTIHSIDWVAPTSSSLSGGAKAGIAIGAIAGIAFIFSALFFYWWRPRHQAKTHKKRPSVVSQAPTYLSSDAPPHYRDTKPYDPWAAITEQQQQSEHAQRGLSVSEMPAGADGHVRRPELEGVGVGGGSYELAAPVTVTTKDMDGTVYEMGESHPSESASGQDNGGEGRRTVERRASEQRRPVEPRKPSRARSLSS
ncbi:putative peptidase aspartic protein [Lasiodiplodia theobromae]|nr:putative peptidase aspartic protein [Lasiodiplodia theobromae]